MIEWFKVSVLKTDVCLSYRGFKSHSILLILNKKARNGFEPLLKDLQSFTLPLCYLAKKINYVEKKKKIFLHKFYYFNKWIVI